MDALSLMGNIPDELKEKIQNAMNLLKEVLTLNNVQADAGLAACTIIVIALCKNASVDKEYFMQMISEVWDDGFSQK